MEKRAARKKEKWLKVLKERLTKSRANLTQKISSVFSRFSSLDEAFWDEIESVLVQADVGVETTGRLIKSLKEKARLERVNGFKSLIDLLESKMLEMLVKKETPPISCLKPEVVLVVGVNGAGKTTAIAKMAYRAKKDGKKVLLAAADTYRAAAIEQLELWARKVGVDIVKHERGADAAAVVFDAVSAAKARDMDTLIIDTAGRLHTYVNLMEELKKVRRVAAKEASEENIRTLLTIDATTGQNALSQTRLFNEALRVDGIILTKLDGTAKGGIVLAIYDELKIPVELIGIGEGLDDLLEFRPSDFLEALLEK